MKKLNELTEQMNLLKEEINAIKQQELHEKNLWYVGKSFVFTNSYSCPQTDDDYWSVYTHISSCVDGYLYGTMFQTDKYGKFEIEFETQIYHIDESVKEIPYETFLTELNNKLNYFKECFDLN